MGEAAKFGPAKGDAGNQLSAQRDGYPVLILSKERLPEPENSKERAGAGRKRWPPDGRNASPQQSR